MENHIEVISDVYELIRDYDKTTPKWIDSIISACLRTNPDYKEDYAEDISRFADWLFKLQVSLFLCDLFFQGKYRMMFDKDNEEPCFYSSKQEDLTQVT